MQAWWWLDKMCPKTVWWQYHRHCSFSIMIKWTHHVHSISVMMLKSRRSPKLFTDWTLRTSSCNFLKVHTDLLFFLQYVRHFNQFHKYDITLQQVFKSIYNLKKHFMEFNLYASITENINHFLFCDSLVIN